MKKDHAEFARLYPNTTNRELTQMFGVSMSTVLAWARRLGLRKDPGHWSRMQSQRSAGRTVSVETRAKLSAAAKGRRPSAETIAKSLRSRMERGTLPRGDAHYRWKGGRPWERFRQPEYQAWRRAVLTRDGYRCHDCGRQCKKYERGLAAHHIRSYEAHPELRYEVDNGVTLCRDCHLARHKRQRRAIAIRPCACGCGTIIASEDVYGRPRRYVNHHSQRGRPLSEAARAKLRAGRTGRPLKPEHRARISHGLRNSKKRIGRPPKRI